MKGFKSLKQEATITLTPSRYLYRGGHSVQTGPNADKQSLSTPDDFKRVSNPVGLNIERIIY